MTSTQLVTIGFSEETNAATKARTHDCSKKLVFRAMGTTAMGKLIMQELLLRAKVEELEKTGVDWVMSAEMFDETGEKVAVQVDRQSHKATWEIMVIGFRLCWGLKGKPPEYMDIILPPLPVTSTEASKLWDALTSHPLTAPFVKLRDRLFRVASDSMHVICLDNATPNIRIHAHELVAMDASILAALIPCGNHCVCLAYSGTMFACLGPAPMLNLYHSTKFLNVGTHRLRCSFACLSWVHQPGVLIVRNGLQPASDRDYAKLKSSLLRWQPRNVSCASNVSGTEHRNTNFEHYLNRHFKIVQGGYER